MSKKPKPARVPVPLSDLEEHFRDQLQLLRKSARDFDAGDEVEFKRMALAMRVLLYDGGASHSLVGQLGLKQEAFRAYSQPHDARNLLSDLCLVGMRMDASGAMYVPNLAGLGDDKFRPLSFEDWWSETVLCDTKKVCFSRGDFILIVANQAGGAHVDKEIDERYHDLIKNNSAGWNVVFGAVSTNPQEGKPLERVEKANVRHIAFEVLATLEPMWRRIIGNRGCDCGSGRKARYCCLKEAA